MVPRGIIKLYAPPDGSGKTNIFLLMVYCHIFSKMRDVLDYQFSLDFPYLFWFYPFIVTVFYVFEINKDRGNSKSF